MDLAPIILFLYNRPEHTEQTLAALQQNEWVDKSLLYVFIDGPKHGASPEEKLRIDRVREIAHTINWCKSVIIEESFTNKGLADSIVEGVSKVINKHGKAIVLEDDIVTTPGFLRYMNDALMMYQDNRKVMHISGYQYPITIDSSNSTIILDVLSCWGWGTWKSAWDQYIEDPDTIVRKIGRSARSINKFNIEGHAHFYKQLELNKSGEIKTWAVKWYASWYLMGGHSLFPVQSLVKNIGHDGSGENCDPNEIYDSPLIEGVEVVRVPIKENRQARKALDLHFKSHFNIVPRENVTLLRKISFKIRKAIRYIVLKALPEIKDLLESEDLDFFRSAAIESSIDSKAKVYPPYKLRHSSIDKYTYISPNGRINNTKIGKFCSIGPNLVSGWGLHPLNGVSTSPMFYSTLKQNGTSLSRENKILETKPISIGNDVFIGMNVTILDGVSIGDGAVIGAGAVVSKDIPAYAIAFGNPIQVHKYRHSETQIRNLRRIKWWEWPEEKLSEVERMFFEVQEFIDNHITSTK
tara:strand:+ start:24487 stop:26055 length:1569 start_codon:yes stop_codon:yes gene_type:complete